MGLLDFLFNSMEDYVREDLIPRELLPDRAIVFQIWLQRVNCPWETDLILDAIWQIKKEKYSESGGLYSSLRRGCSKRTREVAMSWFKDTQYFLYDPQANYVNNESLNE